MKTYCNTCKKEVVVTNTTDDANDEQYEVCPFCLNDDFAPESAMFHDFEPLLHFNQVGDCGIPIPTENITITRYQFEMLKYAAMLACRNMVSGAVILDKVDFLEIRNKAVQLAIDCGLDEQFITTLKEIE